MYLRSECLQVLLAFQPMQLTIYLYTWFLYTYIYLFYVAVSFSLVPGWGLRINYIDSSSVNSLPFFCIASLVNPLQSCQLPDAIPPQKFKRISTLVHQGSRRQAQREKNMVLSGYIFSVKAFFIFLLCLMFQETARI